MNEQDNQSSYYYNPNNCDNNTQQYVQQPLVQPEQPKKKNKALKALKIIGIIFGVIIILFIALVIIAVATDDTDYDESTSQNEMLSEEDSRPELGVFTDKSYTNAYAHIKFNLPSENWEFKDSEYIYDIFRDSGGAVDEDGNVFLDGGNTKYYYDMMALDNTTSTSVQLVFTKPSDKLFNTTTEDMFLNNSKAVSGETTASDIYDIVIAGERYRAIDLADENSELDFGQIMAAKKLEDEFVIIIISGYSKVSAENLSDCIDYFVKP